MDWILYNYSAAVAAPAAAAPANAALCCPSDGATFGGHWDILVVINCEILIICNVPFKKFVQCLPNFVTPFLVTHAAAAAHVAAPAACYPLLPLQAAAPAAENDVVSLVYAY